jgi:hypothetical protein
LVEFRSGSCPADLSDQREVRLQVALVELVVALVELVELVVALVVALVELVVALVELVVALVELVVALVELVVALVELVVAPVVVGQLVHLGLLQKQLEEPQMTKTWLLKARNEIDERPRSCSPIKIPVVFKILGLEKLIIKVNSTNFQKFTSTARMPQGGQQWLLAHQISGEPRTAQEVPIRRGTPSFLGEVCKSQKISE